MKLNLFIYSMLLLLGISCTSETQVIYDESDVPDYTLPEILISNQGDSIHSTADWRNMRREEILELFSSEVYGHFPDKEYTLEFEENLFPGLYFNDRARVKEIKIKISTENGSGSFIMLYIYPSEMKNVPVFVGLNFEGNHTVDTLSLISIHSDWVENDQRLDISNHTASSKNRGASSSRWPIQTIIDHGYGLATAYYGAIDPDYDDGFINGLHPLFADTQNAKIKRDQSSISMWAKGMSLMLDYLQKDSITDSSRIIAIGHSRLGKTTLWSAANDERFSAVISNNSGCGGAALSMRSFGETVGRINTVFPHWFCENFSTYNNNERKLPVDQHMLLALMAPRPVYVASATDDQWADPMGEFLALKEASIIYELYGNKQEYPKMMPQPNIPYSGITGYHIRSGKHDLTEFDWIMYLNWCDKWLQN